MKRQFLLLAVVIGFSIVVVSYNFASAELYRDFDGKLVSEEQYKQRVDICLEILDQLPSDTDCESYALTEKIHNYWFIKYVLSGKFKDFLDSKGIDLDD